MPNQKWKDDWRGGSVLSEKEFFISYNPDTSIGSGSSAIGDIYQSIGEMMGKDEGGRGNRSLYQKR